MTHSKTEIPDEGGGPEAFLFFEFEGDGWGGGGFSSLSSSLELFRGDTGDLAGDNKVSSWT